MAKLIVTITKTPMLKWVVIVRILRFFLIIKALLSKIHDLIVSHCYGFFV